MTRQLIGFAVAVTLARILSPDEFGTMAMLSLFLGVASVFASGGFAAALIQRRDASAIDESTVFWMNLLLGTIVALGLWACAPLIARYYRLPILKPLVAVAAASVWVSSLGSIHATLLTKALRFDALLRVGVVGSLVSGLVALVLAWKGFGVWALAIQALLNCTVTTAGYWIISGWRPTHGLQLSSASRLFSFGGYSMGAALLDTVYGRFYTAVIGRWYGPSDLGFYGRAEGVQQLPVNMLTGIVARVSFPVFVEASGDPEKLRRGIRLALQGIMFINVPAMAGLALIADPLVVLLFGAKWAPSVPIVKVLCLSGLMWPLHVVNLNVLMAQGRSDLFFRLEVIKKALGIGLMIGGARLGILGLAWSFVAAGVLAAIVNTWYSKSLLRYGLRQQVLDVLPICGASLPMIGVVAWVNSGWHPAAVVKVPTLVILGAGAYILTAFLVRSSVLNEAAEVLRSLKAKQR